MNLPCPEHILFDLDGTLAETAPDMLDCMVAAYHTVGLPVPINLEEYHHWVGPPLLVGLPVLSPGYECDVYEKIIETFRNLYKRSTLEKTRLFTGVPEILEDICRRGIHTYLVTNKRSHQVERILAKILPQPPFEQILTPDCIPGRIVSKAEMVKMLVDVYQISDSNAWLVGDSRTDVEAARQNDIPCIISLGGYGDYATLHTWMPDATIVQIDRLAHLLQGVCQQ